MEELRKYINILDEIKDLLDELPMLNYDIVIEEFYEGAYEKIEKHSEEINRRLEIKEKEKLCIR